MLQPIKVLLFGAPTCRRYKTMRQRLLQTAQTLNVPLDLQEVNDTDALSAFNPLHLPMLQVADEIVAKANPPSPVQLEQIFRQYLATGQF